MIPILTVQQIKLANLWIDSDIGDDIISQACVNCQKEILIDTLGYNYFNSIYNQFLSGGTTGFTTPDQFIYDNFLIDILSFSIANELVESLFWQLKSDGLRTPKSSQSDTSPKEAITMEHNRFMNKINIRRELMVKYMKDNMSSYPLYFEQRTKIVNTFPIYRMRSRRGGNWSRW
jgi:hypothetical protein